MSASPKREYVEGRQAFENFENAMGALLKVSHTDLKAAMDIERRQRATAKAAKSLDNQAQQSKLKGVKADRG